VPLSLSPPYHHRALSPLRRGLRRGLRASQRQHAAELRPLFLQATETLGDRGYRPEEPFRGKGGPKEIVSVLLGQCGQCFGRAREVKIWLQSSRCRQGA